MKINQSILPPFTQVLRKIPFRLSTRPVGQWLFSQPINYIMLSSMTNENAVEKQEYLESLSENDRENLGLLITIFLDYCHEKKLSGALLAVGGSVKPETRGTRRKDIDLIPLVNGRDSFDDFRALMEYLKTKAEFNISKVIKPAMDEEFGNPRILKHTGSITLQADTGVPLEFIRLEEVKSWQQIIQEQKDYYSLIVASKQ